MALDAAEQAQIRTLADGVDDLRRIVKGVPPNKEGLQVMVARQAAEIQRLRRVVDGDPDIDHKGLRGQLSGIEQAIKLSREDNDRRMKAMEDQLGAMTRAKEAETNRQQGMVIALRIVGTLLGSSLMLQLAQVFGLVPQ